MMEGSFGQNMDGHIGKARGSETDLKLRFYIGVVFLVAGLILYLWE